MRASTKLIVSCWLLFFQALSVWAGDVQTLFHEDFEKPIEGRWQQVTYGSPTDYRVVVENSNACLRGHANGTASALAIKLDLALTNVTTFSWRWKISGCPTNGSDDRARTFDHAGRVFIAFDSATGPPYSINYVWANVAPSNSAFSHPELPRARFIAVESGNARAGQWWTEQRDLKRDWQRLFKNEPMPKIVGIGVFTDSDGTSKPVTAWYDDILVEGNTK